MSFNKSPIAFSDVKALMDEAVTREFGLKVTFSSKGEMTRLVQRANFYRQLDRKSNAEIYSPGQPLYNSSIYDQLIIRRKEEPPAFHVIFEKLNVKRFVQTDLSPGEVVHSGPSEVSDLELD